ncbi:hypothetical protein AVEN_126188-1 [Araneus ventricosus]|uniref:Uncharacterized protein n=1 Tax=Araneus ventricosus TaxID=182803 RepID=A0A4Y2RZT1_ARAVE|nr:hypothetical protein AVEN_126188-1 [Araneus ventricosus]
MYRRKSYREWEKLKNSCSRLFQGTRGPSGKVSTPGPEGRRPETRFHRRSAVYGACCTPNHTSSRWCGVKIPTLARPTQEGCKAGRGPARREPLPEAWRGGASSGVVIVIWPRLKITRSVPK